MNVLPEHAAAELLRRQRARESLVEFSQSIEVPGAMSLAELAAAKSADGTLVDPLDAMDESGKLLHRFDDTPLHFTPIESRVARHHILIMEAIQRCIETSRGRLIIMAPPGSAKSTYVSVVAPAWAMGRRPDTQIIMASYASSIAAKQSRKVRTIVKSPRYSTIWKEKPILLDDQRAIDDWKLTNGSSMMSAGILAGITGNRADGFIGDDLLANREQADSATIREKIYNEFYDTALTRAKPHMWAILVATRWHEDDLIGSILPTDYAGECGRIKCRDGQTWEVLCIPAEAERADDVLGRRPRTVDESGREIEGEFLWPEWFPREHWSTWRDNVRQARTWSALYQQRPAPSTGLHFNPSMFRRYDPSLPRTDERIALA